MHETVRGRPVPDDRVITAAITVFKRMRQADEGEQWLRALLPLAPGCASNKFVVSAVVSLLGHERAGTLVHVPKHDAAAKETAFHRAAVYRGAPAPRTRPVAAQHRS